MQTETEAMSAMLMEEARLELAEEVIINPAIPVTQVEAIQVAQVIPDQEVSPKFCWDEATVANLARMWAEGWPCSQIAKALGTTIGGVASKRKRLGLAARVRIPQVLSQVRFKQPTPEKPQEASQERFGEGAATLPALTPENAPAPLPEPNNPIPEISGTLSGKLFGPVTLLAARDDQCRWPVSPPGVPYLCCGQLKASPPDSSQSSPLVRAYCEQHARMAYAKTPPSRSVIKPPAFADGFRNGFLNSTRV